jgi:hypothetical protein
MFSRISNRIVTSGHRSLSTFWRALWARVDLCGPATRHHEDGSGECAGGDGPVSEWSYACCAAGDFPQGDDGHLPGDVHDPCPARLSECFFSHCSFLEMLVWGAYPIISSLCIKLTGAGGSKKPPRSSQPVFIRTWRRGKRRCAGKPFVS